MPELRQEPITKKWVIIATERSKRPKDFSVPKEEKKEGTCPFCEGNESLTPPEVLSYRKPGTNPNQPGWYIRVVPNKFPALQMNNDKGSLSSQEKNFYTTLPGKGVHEVIIETPEHNTTIERHSLDQLEKIFHCWQERHNQLMKEDNISYVQIFKNEGAVAGASLYHPHSQLLATSIIPETIAEELEGAQKYYQEKQKCIYCDINQLELKNNIRVVSENEGFLAYCPFASRFPFEIWIVPKLHNSSFSALDDSSIKHLSRIVKETISNLAISLNHPPYNLILHTAPTGYENAPYYHWHIEILPRLTVIAGFEWGTGIYINPTPPEEAARYLRESSKNPTTVA
ncbi:MAG: galactose-1-phosphate uridylyltransferase [Thermacetogeniaceae bacterium]